MISEIVGSTYRYLVDTSYGINKDGFIAIGTESIVYKGLKVDRDSGLQFSCVLKFKPKRLIHNGQAVDRLKVFKTEEWKTFEELRECRSVVQVMDVVDNLGDFLLPCNKVVGGEINDNNYFCVIEEFIDGWTLEEFCREEYWKLRKVAPLGNGLYQVINYNYFSQDEKKAISLSYNYNNILKYQNQILLFMINLCEIMEFVTEQKGILHLDIKPENIMVTRHGRELVLIDFGRSKRITAANKFAKHDLQEVDYTKDETVDRMYQYGALGYAAPECYARATANSSFPFSLVFAPGMMSIESDLFSFGATFWECLNIYELVTKNVQFSNSPYDFYKANFLGDAIYFNRDLSCTSEYYHKKLENIVKKCTRSRTLSFALASDNNYYHSYQDLKKDLEDVIDSAPTIVREENVRVKKALSTAGVMLALFTLFMLMFIIYRLVAFGIAQEKWNEITSDYNDTQLYRLEEVADDLITSAPANKVDATYTQIAHFTYKDGSISEYEAIMLVRLLEKMPNSDSLPNYIDEIMRNADTKKYREITIEIIKLSFSGESVGNDLARAIFDVEVSKTGVTAAYETLEKYKDSREFNNALVKLKNVLDNDENIMIITHELEITKSDVQEFFSEIN